MAGGARKGHVGIIDSEIESTENNHDRNGKHYL